MALLLPTSRLYWGAQALGAMYADEVKLYEYVEVFDPTSLSGLTVWTDASTLPAGPLPVWPNPGSGSDGLVEGTPLPEVVAGGLNGLNTVRFRPSQGRIRGTGMVVQDSFDVSVFLIARMVGPNLGRIFTNAYPPYNFLVGAHTSLDEWLYDQGSPPGTGVSWTGPWPAPWKMYEAVCSGTPRESRLFVNGQDRGMTPTSVGHDTRWNLSGYAATEETCDCEVAELVIYDRPLTTDERVEVETYLRGKWGL